VKAFVPVRIRLVTPIVGVKKEECRMKAFCILHSSFK
jgi:hypothetical protein